MNESLEKFYVQALDLKRFKHTRREAVQHSIVILAEGPMEAQIDFFDRLVSRGVNVCDLIFLVGRRGFAIKSAEDVSDAPLLIEERLRRDTELE